MIQAPNTQYVPQLPMQTVYQQGAYTPVQYQAAQVANPIYNYPTTSSYMPAQHEKSQFNGVNIEILNPQGQGSCGLPQQNLMPAQYVPVSSPFVANPAINNAPVYPAAQPAPLIANTPVTPAAVPQLPPPQINPQTMQQPQASASVNATPNTQPNANVQPPVVEQPTSQQPSINPETFAGRLRNNDVDAQKDAIEEVAKKVKKLEPSEISRLSQDEIQKSDLEANVLLDSQIFDALVDIVNKDTTSLEGPTPEVLELRQKNPSELTNEEKAKIAPTPLEKAEINKQYALYTISYMQDRLNSELEKRNGKALELKDLPCISTVIDAAKSNQNPMIRIAALASLSHIAQSQPSYKQDMKVIFELAKSDEDNKVRETATTALENLNGTVQNQQVNLNNLNQGSESIAA